MPDQTAAPRHLPLSLLLLRLGVLAVMIPWTIDKFVRPDHAAGVLGHFYGIEGAAATTVTGLGIAQTIVIVAFALGYAKRWSYGAVLVLHTLSTLSSYRKYLDPFGEGSNLLFFAAWPMLAACVALYLLREHDTLASPGSKH